MDLDWDAVLGAVVVSLVVVPVVVGRLLRGGASPAVVGGLAMLPGVLMGAAALWVAARG